MYSNPEKLFTIYSKTIHSNFYLDKYRYGYYSNTTKVVLILQIIEEKNEKDIGENNGLKEAAIAAITGVRWQPAKKDGKPITVRVTIPINFKLKNGDKQVTSESQKSTSKSGDVPDFIQLDSPPEPIGGFAAIQRNLTYPEIARRAGIEGMVLLYALIDENGEIVQTKVLKTLGDNNGCDEAAIQAIKNVEWEPGIKEDKPVKVWVTIPINFKLKESK